MSIPSGSSLYYNKRSHVKLWLALRASHKFFFIIAQGLQKNSHELTTGYQKFTGCQKHATFSEFFEVPRQKSKKR